MGRPVTLFTGQWADLTLDDLAQKAASWGFDGLELASWGDHFEVDRALAESDYIPSVHELLNRHGLKCWSISNHLVGQAVCDPIDSRHRAILPAEVCGDGDPEGVRGRAARRMMDTARAAAQFGVSTVTGFTGSSVWNKLYSFPPNDFAEIEKGYEDFAERWKPILDVFAREGVRFALEVHPTEIAYDFVTTRKTLDAIGNRPDVSFPPARTQPFWTSWRGQYQYSGSYGYSTTSSGDTTASTQTSTQPAPPKPSGSPKPTTAPPPVTTSEPPPVTTSEPPPPEPPPTTPTTPATPVP